MLILLIITGYKISQKFLALKETNEILTQYYKYWSYVEEIACWAIFMCYHVLITNKRNFWPKVGWIFFPTDKKTKGYQLVETRRNFQSSQ